MTACRNNKHDKMIPENYIEWDISSADLSICAVDS